MNFANLYENKYAKSTEQNRTSWVHSFLKIKIEKVLFYALLATSHVPLQNFFFLNRLFLK